jgi:protein SCO1/2
VFQIGSSQSFVVEPVQRDGHAPSVLIGNEATGQWIRSAALDDPRYLAVLMGQWMDSWATAKPVKSYAQAPAMHTPDRGEYLFRTRCADCHSMGANDKIGPGLANVAARLFGGQGITPQRD